MNLSSITRFAAVFLIAIGGLTAQVSAEDYLGDIKLTAVGFDQRGWVHCDGKELLISEHQSLFSLLGTGYGGDGRSTFKLPDLRKQEEVFRKAANVSTHAPDHLRYVISIDGLFPPRN